MDRRTLLGTVATGGAVSLAGCGVFEVTSGDSGASAREEQVAAVNDHLRRIFESLGEYTILADGAPAVDPEAYSPEDLVVLRQEFKGAQMAVEELYRLKSGTETPAESNDLVRDASRRPDRPLMFDPRGCGTARRRRRPAARRSRRPRRR